MDESMMAHRYHLLLCWIACIVVIDLCAMALELQQDLAFLDQPTSVVTISFNEANVCVCAREREREVRHSHR
jgi:hypothetical protein